METAAPTTGKITMGELKQKYSHLVERTKQQKQKIEQLLENQRALQNGISERDLAIESRDKLIEECKQINEENVSRMQLKDYQLAELFNTISSKNEEIESQNEKIAALQREIASEKEKMNSEESKIDLSRYEELVEENRKLRSELMRVREESAEKEDTQELNELRRTNSELSSQLASLKLEVAGRAENEERLMLQIRQAQEEIKSPILDGDMDTQNELRIRNTEILTLRNDLENARSSCEKLKAAFQQQSLTLEEKTNELKGSTEKLQKLDELNKAMRHEIEMIKGEAQTCAVSLKEELKKKEAVIAQMMEKQAGYDTQLNELLMKKQSLENEKAAMESQLRTVSFENQRNSKTLTNLQKVAAEYEHSLAEKKSLAESKGILEQQLKNMTEENTRNRETVATLAERCQKLEAQNAKLAADLKEIESAFGTTKIDAAKNGALCESITLERDRLAEKHEKTRAKYKEQKHLASLAQRELEELKAQLGKTKADLQESEKNAQNIQIDLDLTRKKMNEREIHFHSASEDLRALNEDTQTNLKLVERELEALKQTSAQNEKQLVEELQAMKARAEESESMLANLTKTRKGNETKVRSLEMKTAELERQKEDLVQKVDTLQKEITEAKAARDSNVHSKYLKKVMLQFFLQDGSTREALVPVLLSLVGCDEKLIQQAQRNWASSNQIISRSFFKF